MYPPWEELIISVRRALTTRALVIVTESASMLLRKSVFTENGKSYTFPLIVQILMSVKQTASSHVSCSEQPHLLFYSSCGGSSWMLEESCVYLPVFYLLYCFGNVFEQTEQTYFWQSCQNMLFFTLWYHISTLCNFPLEEEALRQWSVLLCLDSSPSVGQPLPAHFPSRCAA